MKSSFYFELSYLQTQSDLYDLKERKKVFFFVIFILRILFILRFFLMRSALLPSSDMVYSCMSFTFGFKSCSQVPIWFD